MIFIIEGPDRCGKTTLAKAIANRYGFAYVHVPHRNFEPSQVSYYANLLDSYRDANVVFDRFVLSEKIYSSIVRFQDSIGDDGYRQINRLMQALPVVKLLCMAPFETALMRFKKASGKYFDEQDYTEIYKEFIRFANKQDTEYVLCQEQMDVELFNTSKLWHSGFSLPRFTVGNPFARYLVVDTHRHSVNTIVPYIGGEYLERLWLAFKRAGFIETDLAWTIAYTSGAEENALPKTNAVGLPWLSVIAISRSAALVAKRAGFSDVLHELPHFPTWVETRNELIVYSHLLKGARV